MPGILHQCSSANAPRALFSQGHYFVKRIAFAGTETEGKEGTGGVCQGVMIDTVNTERKTRYKALSRTMSRSSYE
jgi:hypothetical protein